MVNRFIIKVKKPCQPIHILLWQKGLRVKNSTLQTHVFYYFLYSIGMNLLQHNKTAQPA